MKTSKVITAATSLPVKIHELKEHLGIFHDEKNHNLEIILGAAVTVAEKFTGQIFRCGGEVFDQVMDSFSQRMEIDYSPATGVTSVKYFDSSNTEQTLSTGSYKFLDFTTPQTVEIGSNVTTPSTYTRNDAVTIRYVAGYANPNSVPGDVKAAILLIAQYLYDNPGDSVRQLPTASEYILRNYKVK